jgi:phosphotransferase system HPr (HPr) family protein
MLLAERAGIFTSTIGVRRTDAKNTVDGKSIMQLLMLAGTAGTVLEITAEGDDATDALASIAELIERGFEDDE